jgi:hypothetical protein
MPETLSAACEAAARVALTNTGNVTWRSRSGVGIGHVRAGIQLLDAQSRMIDRDFARGELPNDLAPGESAQVTVSFRAPAAAGDYRLKFDLVAEGLTWFEPGGSATVIAPLRVR